MSEKKVKLHTLERLDLIDVDAIQAQLYKYIRTAIGNVLGNHNGGLLVKPASLTFNGTTDVLNLGDYTFITSNKDTTV